jgi:hypothetical protein
LVAARPYLFAALILASAAIAGADMVKCKKADGSLYVGPTPPENCVPVGTLRAPGGGSGSSWKAGEFLPTPTPAPPMDEQQRQQAEAARKKQIEERRAMPAVVLQNTYNRVYRGGPIIEGTVANSASFPVYSVRVCMGDVCQPASPSTLQPGAQGTFSFPVSHRGFPDWKVTWDVVPEGSE